MNHAVALSKEHAERAKSALGLLPESREKQALLMMADFVSQEDQVGLQREKHVQSRATPRRCAVLECSLRSRRRRARSRRRTPGRPVYRCAQSEERESPSE